MKPRLSNKGTGAGGANTNVSGIAFENKTNNHSRLIEQGFVPGEYGCLIKQFHDKTIKFVIQDCFKKYMKAKYNLVSVRKPDEAYIIEYNDGRKVLKILEKKAQNVAGSVDTKLLTGPIFIEEYTEALEGQFEVQYAFCVSKFLQDMICSPKKKYIIFNNIMRKYNIPILFGDDETYFLRLDNWVFQ